jgi:hypothetical protein
MNLIAAFNPFVELRIFRISDVLSSARYRERRVAQVEQIKRIYYIVIIPRSHAHRGESTVGTRRLYRKALSPIFPVRSWASAASCPFGKPTYSMRVFSVGYGVRR